MKTKLEFTRTGASIAELVAYFYSKGFDTMEGDFPYAERVMKKGNQECTIHKRSLLDCIAYCYTITE